MITLEDPVHIKCGNLKWLVGEKKIASKFNKNVIRIILHSIEVMIHTCYF